MGTSIFPRAASTSPLRLIVLLQSCPEVAVNGVSWLVLTCTCNSYITGPRFVSDLSALGARARSAQEHSADKSELHPVQ